MAETISTQVGHAIATLSQIDLAHCGRLVSRSYAHLLQPAPGLASYQLGQKTTISERYAHIDQAPIYIVHDMTPPLLKFVIASGASSLSSIGSGIAMYNG
ncbi:hypothetical protein ACN38_g1794 [Penicillium nordicum]|uniref:Uncharacterized protein n=1 Tax=Penicillium nordicum TaxID=229535 RepID=A0A0M9WJI8_9EURO|nr:hypothetical protein ACN38_g1794 [Penicillium nordicum]